MPVALREHQHEILGVDDAEGLVFGTEDTGYLTLTRPVIVGGEVRSNDVDMPQEDGRMFGRDYLSGKAMQFEMGVLTDRKNAALNPDDPHRANIDALDRFEGWWLSERWRDNPRALAVLRTHEAGQTWRCYGRPSRYDEIAGRLTVEGYTPITAEFRLADSRWYSDHESSVDIPLVAGPEGGLIAPLVAPLRTIATSSATGLLVVAGSTTTWPVIEFHGPVTNPEVTIGSTVVGLDTYVEYDATVTVDTRPWVRTVTRDVDGAGLAGAMSRRTPVMSRCRLTPGPHIVSYRGTSETGTSWCRIRWRDARSRP